MLDAEQIDKRLSWPRHGLAPLMPSRQECPFSIDFRARHHAMGPTGLIERQRRGDFTEVQNIDIAKGA
jgi:hypothetical protein